MLASATSGVRKLNNEGVVLAQRGDFKTAIEKLAIACNEAPFNPRIMMNAAWVILKYIDQAGMDDTLIATARSHLAAAGRQAMRGFQACDCNSRMSKPATAYNAPTRNEIRQYQLLRGTDS